MLTLNPRNSLAVTAVCLMLFGCGSADKGKPSEPAAVAAKTDQVASPPAVSIPMSFQGVFEPGVGCAASIEAGGATDSSIFVRADSIDSNEGWCDLRSISASSDNSFMGVFDCATEGENAERTRSIRIAESGRFMFDDYAEPFQKCIEAAPPRPQYASAENEEEGSAVTDAASNALALPKHLSCAKTPITRWEDGSVIYNLETDPAMIAFTREKYIFSGKFTQESPVSGTIRIVGMLNVATGKMSGEVNRTERLEVLSVDAGGLYTVRNNQGIQLCLADAEPAESASSNASAQRSPPPPATLDSQPAQSREDAFVASYARELEADWMRGGACGPLLQVVQQIAVSGSPANVRVMQIDKIVDRAYAAGCIMR